MTTATNTGAETLGAMNGSNRKAAAETVVAASTQADPADDARDAIGGSAGGEVGEDEHELVGHQDPTCCRLGHAGLLDQLRQVDDVDDPAPREQELDDAEVDAE